MTQKQMERDMENWSRDKLVQWYEDSFSRYEMAGLNRVVAARNLAVQLMLALADTLDRLGVPPDEVGEKLAETMRDIRALRERGEKS